MFLYIYFMLFLVKNRHAFPNNTTYLETKKLHFIIMGDEYE